MAKKHGLLFVRYHAPHGRRSDEYYETDSDELATMHQEVLAAGGGPFTIEILMTGHVSIACEGDLKDGQGERDIAIAVAKSNDDSAGLIRATTTVIETAHSLLCGFRKIMTVTEAAAFRAGALSVLKRYGVWRDGEQFIHDHRVEDLSHEVRAWDLSGMTADQAKTLAGSGARVDGATTGV